MRRTLGLLALAGTVAVAVAQGGGTAALQSFAKALNSANSLSSTYTVQVIGSAPDSYSVSLKKPNLARIDTPQFLVVADGKNITRLDKAAKTYLKEPQNDAALKALFANDELSLFAGFFSADAYKAASVKSLGSKNRKGQSVEAIQANIDANGKKQITYFVGSDKLARAAQFDLNDPSQKVTYIVDAKTFDLDGAVAENQFAFKAPEDSKEVSLDELNSEKWYTNLHEAQQAAIKTNKILMVDFYADW
jgi:outer membrane lipoprotein-sorting protein